VKSSLGIVILFLRDNFCDYYGLIKRQSQYVMDADI
jgi:tRNA A58 N-methylase Trm61